MWSTSVWPLVMVTTGKALVGSGTFLFVSRQDQGPFIHCKPPRSNPFG